MRTTISFITATVFALGMGAPAEAYVVNWRDAADLPGNGQVLAVDQGDGDVLALSAPFEDTQVVRRLDGRTGAVEWTTEVPGDLTSIEVDPTGGRVVLAGAYDGPLEVVVLDRAGQVVSAVDTGIRMTYVADLEVDPESGLACTVGAQGRRQDAQAWVTSCWDRAGAPAFSRTWTSTDVRTVPDDLAIDADRGRVYVAGTARRADRARTKRQDVVVLGYDTGGTLRWKRRQSGAVAPSDLEMALDAARGRIHVLAEPGVIQQPVKLFSFDTRGRTKFVRSWRDTGSVYESAVAVTPKGDVVAVAADGDRASIRTYRPSGRLRSARMVRIADRGDRGGLPQVAIDPARGRVHVVNDREKRRGAVLWSFNSAGRRTSSVLVDNGKGVFAISVVVHDATGTVITSTNPWPEGLDQVVSVRP